MHCLPVVQLIFVLKHTKGFHGLRELLCVHVVDLPGVGQTDGGGDAIVFLLRLLLPTKCTDVGPVERGCNTSINTKSHACMHTIIITSLHTQIGTCQKATCG